jgi:hypothetical protein
MSVACAIPKGFSISQPVWMGVGRCIGMVATRDRVVGMSPMSTEGQSRPVLADGYINIGCGSATSRHCQLAPKASTATASAMIVLQSSRICGCWPLGYPLRAAYAARISPRNIPGGMPHRDLGRSSDLYFPSRMCLISPPGTERRPERNP